MAAEDIVVIGVLLLVVGLGLFVIAYSGDAITSSIVSQVGVNQSTAAVTAFNATNSVTHKFDILFLAVFIGLTLGLIILSWFVPAHPIFYVGYLLIMVMSIIMSAILSNVWEAVSTTPKLTAMLVYFPITNHVLSYLPLYIAVIGFVGITVMFGKIQGGNEVV